ncbi:protein MICRORCHIDIA 7 isoform X2 [Oryza brachyantha]|uniref:protein MICRORCHIDIA 7 isoform X2 n=1 Tax=Oryza brachyantha TaxID=4533 RepID=UPI001ADC1F6D|nr:protein MICRORCHIDIA 7 isoform X2 [Oryza brachyantha]
MNHRAVKTEATAAVAAVERPRPLAVAVGGGGGGPPTVEQRLIELSSSDSDSDGEGGGVGGGGKRWRGLEVGGPAGKRARVSAAGAAVDVPPGFLDPLPQAVAAGEVEVEAPSKSATKQFWKAGDYDGKPLGDGARQPSVSGLDHVRVHPKFLHSNATSHKWALGALAELLDNSLDEVINGATYVNIDMLENDKDKTRMLLVEDDGGGMDPDKMRQCMSLGYSAKSKVASTIGQYGNGFKTSTMRLGADVLVFSRSGGKGGKRHTQSIGMLSYTFLRSTNKEDIVVPMIDYENEQGWKRKLRTTSADWNTSLQTIITWSPYSTEAELLEQFSSIKDQGTRIIIYNLWEDDEGHLELDFDADINDIQLRGGNRDEKNIDMAKKFPNSKHFLTYRHSLRSYASILYLRVPSFFQMILRGKEIEHHNIVTDMMLKKEVKYKPVVPNGAPKDSNMVADVTIGFVKDAKYHVDVQGFNVYHKNRLIKPFWRVWTAAGSGGRGVIGVLEANFIEPAHDKQDFERTTLLARLEARLVQMQKDYWSGNAHRIGYIGTRAGRYNETEENSPEVTQSVQQSPYPTGKDYGKSNKKQSPYPAGKEYGKSNKKSGKASTSFHIQRRTEKSATTKVSGRSVMDGLLDTSDESDSEFVCAAPPSSSRSHMLNLHRKSFQNGTTLATPSSNGLTEKERNRSASQPGLNVASNGVHTIDDHETIIKQLRDENSSLKERLLRVEESLSQELVIERDKNKSLTERLEDAQRQLETSNKEQEALIDIFSEERSRRDQEEENLRAKLKDASSTIQDLLEQLNAVRKGRKV